MASPLTGVLFTALYAFASSSNIFKYFQRRYDSQLISQLNKVLKLKGRHVRAKENVRFLSKCLTWYVTPVRIRKQVRKTRPKSAAGIERAFIKDDINKEMEAYRNSTAGYRRMLVKIKEELSFIDWLRFCKFINKSTTRQAEQLRKKKEATFERLNIAQNGEQQIQHEHIVNLAGVELTDTQKDVLCRGLTFGIPPRIRKEAILAEFEMAWQQLPKHMAEEKQSECKANLSSIAHRFANSKVDRTGFRLSRDHMTAIGQLKKNKKIVITRPDKGNGVVLLTREDYVRKMELILQDTTKFELIGDAENNDRTVQQERALQAFLLRGQRQGHITQEEYERIRPIGSTRPRLYGVPKTHKNGTPLRPILSMVNAPQHEMAKWLTEILRPVVTKYSTYLVKDTFEFCEHIQKFTQEQDTSSLFMCSFDVTNLFTNVPLDETLGLCLDTLYRDNTVPTPRIPERFLAKLLAKATTEVEFSFNGQLYKQVDGVAMGSPLGPVLANIFMGYLESTFAEEELPLLYDRFVDDTFAIFQNENRADRFFCCLNNLHPSLKFTMEIESDGQLPFMDVKVMKTEDELQRMIYRKPTFTGLYTRWDSFCPTKHKLNLIRSLTSRAIKICSESKLEEELQNLRVIFRKNGYPTELVERIMTQTTTKPPKTKEQNEASPGSIVFLKLPWIGEISRKFKKEIEETITKASVTTTPIVSFTTRHTFNGVYKDSLPTTSKSFVVYNFQCCCGKQYVGKTTQVLSERIKQHVTNKLVETKTMKKERNDTAITRHLRENLTCLMASPRKRFKVLMEARSKNNLDVLEALFIKQLKPELCQQKETMRVLELI